MGFSLFGQFAATIILLQTAPIGFATVGWKYFLVVICWCAVFLPGKCRSRCVQSTTGLTSVVVVYLYFPETARLSLEEISQKFGDDVAVHITDASQEDRERLDRALEKGGDVSDIRAGDRDKRLE